MPEKAVQAGDVGNPVMTDAWDGLPRGHDRDGWHWLHHPDDPLPFPAPWDAGYGAWCSAGMHSPRGVVDLGFRYLGPCLLPAEVATMIARVGVEGANAGRTMAARMLEFRAQDLRRMDAEDRGIPNHLGLSLEANTAEAWAKQIRARNLPLPEGPDPPVPK